MAGLRLHTSVMARRDTVEIWSHDEGKDELLGRVRLVDGQIAFSGFSHRRMVQILHKGIASIEQQLVFPSDGQRFLDALPVEFSGSYTRARFANEAT